ncbi:hypothetical protein FA15DRAFT_249987 [Coprinopsis marcescibilis]|uniref:Uncharacterized protein n=1 Tax=Coprinopsis marcescibilis TaxID=230819 RepID=A0A5C3KER9_COPMA|nr:hypothetical protein FA15DRAFT_249987 [Coprinopsis marcescibilis]
MVNTSTKRGRCRTTIWVWQKFKKATGMKKGIIRLQSLHPLNPEATWRLNHARRTVALSVPQLNSKTLEQRDLYIISNGSTKCPSCCWRREFGLCRQ